MKTVFFLAGDYWHPVDTIQPMVSKLFPEDEWEVVFTEDPAEYLSLNKAPDLFVSFKDPIENNQIPTPAWSTPEWTDALLQAVQNGTGALIVHAAMADLKEDHPFIKELVQSVFTGHPAQCPLSFVPTADHPILKDVPAFTFPENDEHYMMKMLGGFSAEIIAETRSQHGSQPGMWVRELGKGRICCVTPGHTTPNLTCDGYLAVLRNAAKWCVRQI